MAIIVEYGSNIAIIVEYRSTLNVIGVVIYSRVKQVFCFASTLQHYNTTTLQHYNTTTLLHYNNTTLQQYNNTTLQHYNTATLQHCNTTTLQHYNTLLCYTIFLEPLYMLSYNVSYILYIKLSILKKRLKNDIMIVIKYFIIQ